MSALNLDKLPVATVGLKLHKVVNEVLIGCEPVFFVRGRDGVSAVLLRAGISGLVDVGGEIGDYFADVLIDESGEWDETVSLDRDSYKSLKNHWMRCKIERDPGLLPAAGGEGK